MNPRIIQLLKEVDEGTYEIDNNELAEILRRLVIILEGD